MLANISVCICICILIVKSLESKISRLKAASKSPKKVLGGHDDSADNDNDNGGDSDNGGDGDNDSDNDSDDDDQEYEMEIEEEEEESGSQYETETEVVTSETDESVDLSRFVSLWSCKSLIAICKDIVS